MKHILGLFIFTLLLPLMGKAQDNTIIADYQEMIRDKKAQTLELKGDVNIIFQQQHLLCDHAIIYEKTKTIVARGNVVLQNVQSTVRGERIEFNYETNKGKIYNGVITSGQVLIEAELIEKVGENEYKADDAYYTACTTCPASWGFTSLDIEAEIGGYAYITRPWLHLLQFPVLPLPYLVVPLNSKRQTGFLVPKPFSNPDGGFAIEQPFFWAIDRSHDATFSLINYEKRGLQGAANYRYVISPRSSGILNTAYLRDGTVIENEFKNRWFVDYAHHYELPDNFTQRTHLAIASDRLYSFDFLNQFYYNGYPALENSISLSKSFENSLLTMEASYYLSQIEANRTFRDDDSLHRLPEFNYNLNDVKVSDDLNLFFSLDAQYLNVVKNGLAYEHTQTGTVCLENDPDDQICYPTALSSGQFVYGTPAEQAAANAQSYGDLIRAGQRLDLKPHFHAPFWVGDVLDVDPSFTLRYTQYSLAVASDESQGYDSMPSRFYGQLGLDIKSDLSRVYNWSEETRFKHSIVPEIQYQYIPKVFQSNHNFFGAPGFLRYYRETQPVDGNDSRWRQGGRGIQFDQNDRVIGKQFVSFALTNKIMRRDLTKQRSLDGGYSRAFWFRVSQAFDINELERGTDARAWGSLNTDSIFEFGPFSQNIHTEYFPYHNRTLWTTGTRLNFLGSNYIQVGYTKNYFIDLEPPVNEDTRTEFLYFKTGIHFPYVYFYGQLNYDLNTGRGENLNPFQRWKIALEITPPGSCWTINAELMQGLNNLIQPSVNMEFKFSD